MDVPAPFRIFNASSACSPIVLSVPHAGRTYPPDCAKRCRVPLAHLVRLEDRYADQLVQACIDAGLTTIIAQTPRLWIDLNRAEYDFAARATPMDGAPLSAKARSGLGLVPTRLAGVGDIWRNPPTPVEISARIAQVHTPYHDAVHAALAAARARFGIAILLDVHSMPPLVGPNMPTIVLGDRFGRSAAMEVSDCARTVCAAAGHRVALNAPYAGAYILERHGRPSANIHALQLEICRREYLDTRLDQPNDRLDALQALVLDVAAALAETISGTGYGVAAE